MQVWWIGVGLALLSSLLGNLGLNLQKLAHTQISSLDYFIAEQKLDISHPSRPEKHPLWQFGMVLIILGSISDFFALSYAPQSVVAPLGAITLVVNIALARIMHGEEITSRGIIATSMILLGSVLDVVFSDHRNLIVKSTGELVGIIAKGRVIGYAAIVGFGIFLLWIWVREKIKDESESDQVKLKFAVTALSGVIGGHSLVFAKFVSEMISEFWGGSWSVPNWKVASGLYVIFGMLIMSLVLQIVWINEALKRFDSVFVVPIAKSFWVFFSVVSGLITFADYQQFTVFECVMFFFGTFCIIIGMALFSGSEIARRRERISWVNDHSEKNYDLL
jgi:uncharacterized membrane protein